MWRCVLTTPSVCMCACAMRAPKRPRPSSKRRTSSTSARGATALSSAVMCEKHSDVRRQPPMGSPSAASKPALTMMRSGSNCTQARAATALTLLASTQVHSRRATPRWRLDAPSRAPESPGFCCMTGTCWSAPATTLLLRCGAPTRPKTDPCLHLHLQALAALPSYGAGPGTGPPPDALKGALRRSWAHQTRALGRGHRGPPLPIAHHW